MAVCALQLAVIVRPFVRPFVRETYLLLLAVNFGPQVVRLFVRETYVLQLAVNFRPREGRSSMCMN